MNKASKKGSGKLIYVAIALYLSLSALGLFFIKAGGSDLSVGLGSGIVSLNINVKMLIGMAFYVCSFLMFTYIVTRFDLTFIYPLVTGVLYVLIMVVGVLVFKEKVGLWQAIGMAMILLGVVAINIKR